MASFLWSLPFIALIGGAILILQNRDADKAARAEAANATLQRAVAEAEQWLSQGNDPGDAIERNLQSAFSDASVSDTRGAAALLDRVRLKRSQFAADALFRDALAALDARDIARATELLQEYLKDEHSTRRVEAQRLEIEIRLSLDQARALETLVAMNDQAFETFRSGGDFADSEVTHPVLREVHAETLRVSLNDAIHRRQQIALAEDLRREADQVAKMEDNEQLRQRVTPRGLTLRSAARREAVAQHVRLVESQRASRLEDEKLNAASAPLIDTNDDYRLSKKGSELIRFDPETRRGLVGDLVAISEVLPPKEFEAVALTIGPGGKQFLGEMALICMSGLQVNGRVLHGDPYSLRSRWTFSMYDPVNEREIFIREVECGECAEEFVKSYGEYRKAELPVRYAWIWEEDQRRASEQMLIDFLERTQSWPDRMNGLDPVAVAPFGEWRWLENGYLENVTPEAVLSFNGPASKESFVVSAVVRHLEADTTISIVLPIQNQVTQITIEPHPNEQVGEPYLLMISAGGDDSSVNVVATKNLRGVWKDEGNLLPPTAEWMPRKQDQILFGTITGKCQLMDLRWQ